MPVKTRELIRHWSAWQQRNDAGPSAAALGNDIWVNGHPPGISVSLHEAVHTLDLYAGSNGQRYSAGSEWKEAVAADSCVPDSYAARTYIEDFAQCGVMVAYDLNVASINNFNVSSMSNQLNRCKETLSTALKYNPGDKCDPARRQTNSYVLTSTRMARRNCDEYQDLHVNLEQACRLHGARGSGPRSLRWLFQCEAVFQKASPYGYG